MNKIYKLTIEEANIRYTTKKYHDYASAIHSVLMELGLQVTKDMIRNEPKKEKLYCEFCPNPNLANYPCSVCGRLKGISKI